MEGLIKSELQDGRYDVLVASQRRMVPYTASIAGLPKIWEEVEVTVIREAYERESSLVRRLRRRLTWGKERAFIRRMAEQVHACTVVSKVERDRLRSVAPRIRRLAIVPNGVDLDHYQIVEKSPANDTLVFNGSLTYAANLDALDFFLSEILPLVLAWRPGVRLFVTGSTEGVDLSRLPLTEGTIFTGYVPDIRPLVADSRVCVAPIRIGGGTRLKILEAMALGTPVVSTLKGVEGLQVKHQHDVWVADDALAFALAVVRLLEDEDLRQSMAGHARRTVEQTYGWSVIGERLNSLLVKVALEAAQ
jgi:glycosyltransferase involved in cell wall biosynthesis